MVRHINDHVPAGAAVSMSEQQLAHLEAAIGDMLDPIRQVAAAIAEKGSAAPAPAVLSGEQFDELKALLQPGFELATLMLAELKASHEPASIDPPKDKPEPNSDFTSES